MKTPYKILLLSLSLLVFNACSEGNKKDDNTSVETATDTPVTLPPKTETTQCKIYEGTPKTTNSITVHVVCTDGGVNIESATVTVKSRTKNVNYSGSLINDYLSFGGLEADTNYEAKLSVNVESAILTDSVTIKTKKMIVSTVTHNGITYGFVTSPYTGKVWLDKNIGAAQVCTSFNDSACYGDYYQWGRNADGHEDIRSGDINIQSPDVNNVGHGDFINVHDDWASVDGTGAERAINLAKTDGTSVCPVGFRVPTITELSAELYDAGSSEIQNNIPDTDKRINAFSTFLKLPTAGYRNYHNAILEDESLWGGLWTGSVRGINAKFIGFADGFANNGNDGRGHGLAIRCLKN